MAGLLVAVSSLISLIGCTDAEKIPTTTTLQPSAQSPTQPVTATPTPMPTATATPMLIPTPTPTATAAPLPIAWLEEVSSIVWVAYSPPEADPDNGVEVSSESIREDLAVLHQAGFTGLVTYGSSGVLGRELPTLAQLRGFQGLIMGIWDPFNQEEIAAVEAAADLPIILGFCVGNEGLYKRYEMSDLSVVIQELREATGKPVATTEEIDDYSDENLIQLGDWVFPNAHPYFHNQLDPDAAVRWTQSAYDDLKRRTDQFVMFKEVGLPTSGDPEGSLSEASQERYYQRLVDTDVQFVYFEAFDQLWKTHLPIESHWGIFYSDRTPKLLGWQLMGKEPSPTPEPAFYIYRDAGSPDNHYRPTGYMGDVGDIHINEAFDGSSHSGQTSIRVVYDAEGKGQNECPYSPPCKWAGVYWQEPLNNWGRDAFWEGKGFDLSDYNRLVFWAKADRACVIEFKVGGINEPYGDSLVYPRSIYANLSEDWQEFEIELEGADLKHIIGGFVWVTNWDTNPGGVTFYLDTVRFERR